MNYGGQRTLDEGRLKEGNVHMLEGVFLKLGGRPDEHRGTVFLPLIQVQLYQFISASQKKLGKHQC